MLTGLFRETEGRVEICFVSEAIKSVEKVSDVHVMFGSEKKHSNMKTSGSFLPVCCANALKSALKSDCSAA